MEYDTILEEAHDIVYNRRDANGPRPYGPFSECMARATNIFNAIKPDNPLSVEELYLALISLKIARESFEHKRDNLVDICGYIAGLDDFINESNNNSNL